MPRLQSGGRGANSVPTAQQPSEVFGHKVGTLRAFNVQLMMPFS